jgi:leader peptidase (prepilin peptidase)/N-methyltransferase
VPSDIPVSFVFVATGILGAMLGSFLNVLIVRLPKDESVVLPRSHCPRCKTLIPWYDNLPVISWLMLAGKCRQCAQPISIQYPLVELGTAALWMGALWYYGFSLTALAAAVFGTILLGIAITDARHYLIPDEYTLGGLVIGLLLALRGGGRGLLAALLGAAVGFTVLYLVAVLGTKAFGKEAMGGGDIKMMAMVGAFTGWQGVLLTIFGGSLLGTLIFVPLSLKQKRLVPFGVFLAPAAALTFLFGEAIVRWYWQFVAG